MKFDLERSRFASPRLETTPVLAEDTLVNDPRAGLTPAQMVERKLVALLPSLPLALRQQQASTRPPD